MCSRVITARFSGGQELESGYVCALKAENGSQLICGFLTFEKYKTALAVNENGYIELAKSVERRLLAPGESITCDWACVKPVSDARFGLIVYAQNGRRAGKLRAASHDHAGLVLMVLLLPQSHAR